MIIRGFENRDLDEIVHLFTETVRKVNSRDYTPGQIAVLAPESPDLLYWSRRLQGPRMCTIRAFSGSVLQFPECVYLRE